MSTRVRLHRHREPRRVRFALAAFVHAVKTGTTQIFYMEATSASTTTTSTTERERLPPLLQRRRLLPRRLENDYVDFGTERLLPLLPRHRLLPPRPEDTSVALKIVKREDPLHTCHPYIHMPYFL